MTFFVVVNKHQVAANRRKPPEDHKPVFRVSKGRTGHPWYAGELTIEGPARLVYCPDRPLPCGASVWLEVLHRPVADREFSVDEIL